MDKFKTVVVITFVVMLVLVLILTLRMLTPPETGEDPCPWFTVGAQNITDLLWDPSMGMFRESALQNQSYWIDDNAKILNLLLEDASNFSANITGIIDQLYSVYHDGYFPRRIVKCIPVVENSNPNNVSISNGFLRIYGNLTDPTDTQNPLRLRYYEASGPVDFGYLGGQTFTVDPEDRLYDSYTISPASLQADQSNNPGFDTNNSSANIEAKTELDLLPWEYDTAKYWSSASSPPNICVYSTKWANMKHTSNNHSWGRCIGLETWNPSGSENDWRSSLMSVDQQTNYTFSFWYTGTFENGTSIRVYLRWFDENQTLIGENVTELSSDSPWVCVQGTYNSSTARYADIRIVSYGDTVARFCFDDFFFGEEGPESNIVPNCNLEEANSNRQWVTDKFHTEYRSLKLYGNEYALQHLAYPVNTSDFKWIYWYSNVGLPTTYDVKVFYADGNVSTITVSDDTSSWKELRVFENQTSPDKTIDAIGFFGKGNNIDTWIDDVGIVYSIPGSAYYAEVRQSSEYFGEMLHAYAIQNYTDSDLSFENRFEFATGQSYVNQTMVVANNRTSSVEVYFRYALDGLSGIYSGEQYGTEDHRAYYTTVWIPGVGRRSSDPNLWMTTLFSRDDPDFSKWTSDYFILELNQIPEWSGCLGLVTKVPKIYFNDLINTASTTYPDRLNYVTYSSKLTIPAESNYAMHAGIVCLNGYDFTNPGIYEYYLMDWNSFNNTDVSMNYHIGMITYALAKYWEVKGNDSHDMAKTTWQYYKNVFQSHSNGSYLMTTGNMILASLKLYRLTNDVQYLDFAKTLADYLVSIQIVSESDVRNGTFPMKHNGVSYLDCQGICTAALKEMIEYNSSYRDAYNRATAAIHFDLKPAGIHRIPVGGIGDDVPNTKRLWIYANSTHIDDDFWIYKATYVARSSLGSNDSLAMLGLSRLWTGTVWNTSTIFIYNSESIPGREIPGVSPEINSETGPWGLVAWLEVAKWQRNNWNLYYMFLTNHYAIVNCSCSENLLHADIYAPIGSPTISTIYYRGQQKFKAVSVRVDGSVLPPSNSPDAFLVSPDDTYYDAHDNWTVFVKAHPKTPNLTTTIEVQFET
jgi:hypothetical protein